MIEARKRAMEGRTALTMGLSADSTSHALHPIEAIPLYREKIFSRGVMSVFDAPTRLLNLSSQKRGRAWRRLAAAQHRTTSPCVHGG